ncbi:hypothetical protein F0562_017492 [Nyssa sinensis]|uniref:Uncharacterized protein n=1 Tax=Nyssa sinensis TaxID=561372 RepID=A0A5J4ZHY1_9ASTE|nr:hypothetical protein F0562_017492 [Nyssa sinensis]
MFLSEKKSVTEGHNAKIEDEIFETSISFPSYNLDKVDEALRVVTKEDEISLLAECSTPAVHHGKGKELKRIEKSSSLVYGESSFHSLSRKSSDYDSKDDAANSKQENSSPQKNGDEGDNSSSSFKKTGSSASNTSRALLKREQKSKKRNDPSISRSEENASFTPVSSQRGSSSQEVDSSKQSSGESEGLSIKKRKAELLYESHKKRKLSPPISTSSPGQGGRPLGSTTEIIKEDWNGKQFSFGDDEKKTELLNNSLSTGVGVEGGKVDVPKPVQLCLDECVFLKKYHSIDANNIGIDIEGVGIDVVDIDKVGVDVKKVGDDDVGVDVEKIGGDDVGVEKVGVEKVGGDDVGVEMVRVDFEKVGGDYVGGEKVGGDYVGGEKTDKVGDLFLRSRVYNRRPLTVVEEIEGIVQNDGTMKPSEAILSTSATDLAGVAVARETLPSRGNISIPNVPTSSHRPISRRYNRVLWFRDMVGEKCVPFLNLVRDRYPQTFENFKCKLPELRSVMLDILGCTIKQLDERAIMSFQISEIHELLCAIVDFKLNGLQVEWLERHLTSLLPCGFYSTFLQQKMKIRQEIVCTRARLSNLEVEEQRLLGLCREKEKEFP